jgi:hypothetical protein
LAAKRFAHFHRFLGNFSPYSHSDLYKLCSWGWFFVAPDDDKQAMAGSDNVAPTKRRIVRGPLVRHGANTIVSGRRGAAIGGDMAKTSGSALPQPHGFHEESETRQRPA